LSNSDEDKYLLSLWVTVRATENFAEVQELETIKGPNVVTEAREARCIVSADESVKGATALRSIRSGAKLQNFLKF